MRKLLSGLALSAALLVAFGGELYSDRAEAQLNQNPPQVTTCGSGDLIQDIVGGNPSPTNTYISCLNLAGYAGQLPAKSNLLIAGDATQNLFQRGTTGSSVTTTVTYGGPDRWAYWSGTSTAITLSRDSTAADLPAAGYQYGYKLARTSGQTGVVQFCMAQEIESQNAYQMQGTTVELDLHAILGATAATDVITAYVITGTGSNEGMTNLAFGLNAGGGGSTAWTGQANATAAVLPASATIGRYAAFATIPVGATEAAVAICDTPVGTAGATDYLAVSGIQLIRNSTQAANVNTILGFGCSPATGGTVSSGANCSSFDRSRGNEVEALLQYRYYDQVTEGAAGTERGLCRSRTTTTCSWDVKFPVPMRIAPTVTVASGFAVETTVAGGTLNNCTLTNDTTVSTGAASPTDAYVLCTATTVPAAGTVDQVYDNGGTGAVKAAAEL